MKQLIPVKSKLPKSVKIIFDQFSKAGYQIYLVGAAVHNLLTGKKKIENCDFTTNATPPEIQKLFPDSFYDNQFGTVGITLDAVTPSTKKEEVYEITTYRTEFGYSDLRHPDQVQWGKTLEEDLSRRDFTINAMVIGPNKKGQLELIDLFNGQKDLKNKVIRAVGNPEDRFNEDALRMIRAIRIAGQLSFTIEENTLKAIQKNASLIKKISPERIRDELFKILESNYPADGFQLLFSSGLLQHLLPELIKGYGLKQARHHLYDVWTHSLNSLRKCPSKDLLVRLATLLHDVGKPIVAKGKGEQRTFYNHEVVSANIARNIAETLHFKKEEREKLVTLVRWHQFSVDEHQTDKAMRRFIRRVGKENIKDMIDLRIGDRLGGGCKTATSWRLRLFLKKVADVQKHTPSVSDLKVNGHDVMKLLKIKPGPQVGKILNQLFEEILDNPALNKRSHLLKRIKELGKTL